MARPRIYAYRDLIETSMKRTRTGEIKACNVESDKKKKKRKYTPGTQYNNNEAFPPLNITHTHTRTKHQIIFFVRAKSIKFNRAGGPLRSR